MMSKVARTVGSSQQGNARRAPVGCKLKYTLGKSLDSSVHHYILYERAHVVMSPIWSTCMFSEIFPWSDLLLVYAWRESSEKV